MLVKAKQGARCPKENKPREYITDFEAVEVPDTIYYKRLIMDGSLLRAENEPAPVAVEETVKKGRA